MEKWVKVEQMYMKNNGSYFNSNKFIFVLQFTVLLYR